MKSKISGIYCITNKINGKKYIGQSIDIIDRFRQHKKKSSNQIISKAIRKYGVDNFNFEILLRCPHMCMNYWENYYIIKHNTINPIGYNLESGGTDRYFISNETRNKMSISAKNRPKISEETKTKLSKASKGRKWSPESKAKLSNSVKGENNHQWKGGNFIGGHRKLIGRWKRIYIYNNIEYYGMAEIAKVFNCSTKNMEHKLKKHLELGIKIIERTKA